MRELSGKCSCQLYGSGRYRTPESLNTSIFEFGKQPTTVISANIPRNGKRGDEPYYPVNNDKNNELYQKYKELADKENKVIFGGRLGGYKYYIWIWIRYCSTGNVRGRVEQKAPKSVRQVEISRRGTWRFRRFYSRK